MTGEGENLVFVLSTPRAGSTLLGAILGSHSRVVCPPEPWLLLPLGALHSRESLMMTRYDQEFAQKAWSELGGDDLFVPAYRGFASSIYEGLLKKNGKDVFVDKTPRYYQILPWLNRLFPRSKKIWIRRNPLDVIASCKETWKITLEELLGETVTPHSFDVTVSFLFLADFFESTSPDKAVINYENVVRAPTKHIQSLCDFLGLSPEKGMETYWADNAQKQVHVRATMGDKKILMEPKPHDRSIGKWKTILTADETGRVLNTLGRGIFRRMGYDDDVGPAARYAGIKPESISEEGETKRHLSAYRDYFGRRPQGTQLDRTVLFREKEALFRRIEGLEAERAAQAMLISQLRADLNKRPGGAPAPIHPS